MNTIGRDYLTAVKVFEEVKKPLCDRDPWRLGFHIMPPVGWLNDPNGLAFFDGKYHVYFQYSPFSPEGGMKCWGHYTSKDLIAWDYEGVALCPDETFDVHGVYSGSALTEGEYMYLYYTGNVKKKGEYDFINHGREANTICTRTRDGIHFEDKRLVMKNDAYGDQMTCHVRDPKVWSENGRYFMVQGGRDKENKGKILLFTSDDKFNWKLDRTIEMEQNFGYMWECPDLFCLDDQWILCFSPQGVEERGYEFQNLYQSGYSTFSPNSREDGELGRFQELDRGFDYYAPQSFLAPDGRRIQIAWMGLPDIEELYSNPTVEYGWQHAMTVPRQLSYKNGKLYQNPVEELKALRDTTKSVEISGEWTEKAVECFELELSCKKPESPFELLLDDGLCLSYFAEEKRFEMAFVSQIGAGRTSRSVFVKQLSKIRVMVDTSSVEIFLNDGEEVFTTRFYPQAGGHQIQIKTEACKGFLWNYKASR